MTSPTLPTAMSSTAAPRPAAALAETFCTSPSRAYPWDAGVSFLQSVEDSVRTSVPLRRLSKIWLANSSGRD
jgi:hypothetical protein